MLAQIRNSPWFCATNCVLLLGAALTLGSCATKEDPQIVSTGAAGRESALPWNEQQKWEGQGTLGPMAERLQNR